MRSKRERSKLIEKRQRRTLAFFKDKIGVPYEWRREVDADQFVKDMRKARTEVPGATQEIPVVGLEAMTRDELRKMAASYNIKGRGAMNKDELISALEKEVG